ncbi:hypothetical protein HYR99_28865 [Candidatus Poribacteria bacterium]|nr:hypothetical protein [Candidatus Poribacteria bacterium]
MDLKAGNNLLLVKVSERGGGWSMFVGLQTDFKAAGKNYAATEEPGDKITGPWLWMIAPSPSCGAAGTDIDWLADASKKKVTEEMVAKKGVTKKDKVDKLTWTEGEIQPTGGNNINDTINKIKLGVGDINNTMSYAYINVVSPEDRSTRMFTGSDDSIKVWLNGEVVWKNAVNRGAGDFQEDFPVKLKKGSNPLLVKVGECGGGWSMFVGFSKEGQRGLKFNLDTPGQAVEAAGKLSTTWGRMKNPF